MYRYKVVIFLFAYLMCLFCTSGEISYSVIRSAKQPSNLKFKLGGSIELPYGSDERTGLRLNDDDMLDVPIELSGQLNAVRAEMSDNNDDSSDLHIPERDSYTFEFRAGENGTKDKEEQKPDKSGETSASEIENNTVLKSLKTGVNDKDSWEQQSSDGSAENSASEIDSNKLPIALNTSVNNTTKSLENQNSDYSAQDSAPEKENNTLPRTKNTEIYNNRSTPDLEVQSHESSADNSASDSENNIFPNVSRSRANDTSDNSEDQDEDSDEKPALDIEVKKISIEDPPVFIPTDKLLHTTRGTSPPKTTKFKRHKVQNDETIRKFTTHVYEQALKAFESMKRSADPYTKQKIDSLAETYKEKFTDFVKNTREAEIKTRQGTQNAILHTIDTSNLIMDRIVKFLKADMLAGETTALRIGGATKLQKEVDTVKALEFEHACKMFGICRSANGFRNELQNIISTMLSVPNNKLLQANDAATEILKNADLSPFSTSYSTVDRIKKAIRNLEKSHASSLRKSLEVLFGAISKSHLPLVVDKSNPLEKQPVKRTVSFHSLLDAIEDALPPTEANRIEWGALANRLKRWKDGEVMDIQGTLQSLFDHVSRGVENYGASSEKIRELVEDIAKTID